MVLKAQSKIAQDYGDIFFSERDSNSWYNFSLYNRRSRTSRWLVFAFTSTPHPSQLTLPGTLCVKRVCILDSKLNVGSFCPPLASNLVHKNITSVYPIIKQATKSVKAVHKERGCWVEVSGKSTRGKAVLSIRKWSRDEGIPFRARILRQVQEANMKPKWGVFCACHKRQMEYFTKGEGKNGRSYSDHT